MGASYGFEDADDATPNGASECAAQQNQRQEQECRPAGQVYPDRGRRDRAHDELSLGADVEHARPEGEGDRDPSHDQRRDDDERVGELQDRRLATKAEEPETAAGQSLVGLERVSAGGGHDDGPDDKGQQHGTGRNGQRPASAPQTLDDLRRLLPGAALSCCGHLAASL